MVCKNNIYGTEFFCNLSGGNPQEVCKGTVVVLPILSMEVMFICQRL